MNVNKILEINRFTALCGGCGEIFHYSTIEEVIFAHQGGPNCETPCQSCTTGVLCACEYCQSLIFTKLEQNAAAPVQVVPTPSGSSRPHYSVSPAMADFIARCPTCLGSGICSVGSVPSFDERGYHQDIEVEGPCYRCGGSGFEEQSK